jgi:uncharacterized membrane protein YgcG
MKRIIIIIIALATLLLTTPAIAQSEFPPIPNPPASGSYVLDTLNWLGAAQEHEINAIARQLDEEGKAEIYVATWDDCGKDKTQYRREIFDRWNIGSQKEYGGLLILVCWYGGDPSRRSVEVKTDEKMQQVIPDAVTAKTAEDEFVPAFIEDHPGRGLVAMVKVFDGIIRHETTSNSLQSLISQINIGSFVIGLILVLFTINQIIGAFRGTWSGGWDGDNYGGGGDFGGGVGGGGGDGGGSSTGF